MRDEDDIIKSWSSPKRYFILISLMTLLFTSIFIIKSEMPFSLKYTYLYFLYFLLSCYLSVSILFSSWYYTDFRMKVGWLRFIINAALGIVSLILMIYLLSFEYSRLLKLFLLIVIWGINLLITGYMYWSATKRLRA